MCGYVGWVDRFLVCSGFKLISCETSWFIGGEKVTGESISFQGCREGRRTSYMLSG